MLVLQLSILTALNQLPRKLAASAKIEIDLYTSMDAHLFLQLVHQLVILLLLPPQLK